MALGRASRIFGLEYFCLHSENEGSKGGKEKEGIEREREKGTFAYPLVFRKTEKGLFTQHKTLLGLLGPQAASLKPEAAMEV